MNTTTESMQRYYDDPALLDNYEIEPDVLKGIYGEAVWKFETSDNEYLIGRAENVLVKLAGNPNIPTVVLKELFQKSFKTFLNEAYFNPYQEMKDRKKGDFDESILKAVINNPVLPLLLLENPNLVENWLTYPYPYSHRLEIVIMNYLEELTKMLEYFNLGVIVDWLEVLKKDFEVTFSKLPGNPFLAING